MDSFQGDACPELVLLERPEQGVALLRLNRPARLNALSMRLRETLAAHVERLDACAETRVVVLTGTATVFAAGADLPLEQALALERKAFQLLFDSHDQKEGMRAFLEKRTAEYLGK
ncbi:enoyl-CoA hydratase-related protein [Pseudomonas paraeruginosa]|uniref:enoyl-CoA hydratase-related protein n=1 Tax=Pseudomonas paraeruginosa TaxID=2994495 RepID=UPI0034D52F92